MLQTLLGIMLVVAMQAASDQAAPTQVPVPEQQTRPQPGAAVVAPSYTIGPDDELKIQVFDEPTLSGSFRVDNDGSFTFPLLGRVLVRGLTVREAEQMLKKQLENGFVNRAQVSVEVVQFRSRSIYIMGEVRTAGKYPLQGDVTLLELLSLAGSLTNEAGDELRILRPRDGSVPSAALQPGDDADVIRISLEDLKLGRLSQNILLHDGDTVIVPTAERFYVYGHVKQPGSFVLRRGMTVQQAIVEAGGVTDRGSTRRLKVRRKVGDQFKEISIKLTDLVQPGDTIQVPQRFI